MRCFHRVMSGLVNGGLDFFFLRYGVLLVLCLCLLGRCTWIGYGWIH